MLSLGLGTAPAFGGAGADKIALHVRNPAEYRQHQAPGAVVEAIVVVLSRWWSRRRRPPDRRRCLARKYNTGTGKKSVIIKALQWRDELRPAI